jgi:hypothetical protein
MTIDDSAIEFFNSMPDDLLIKLALNDWFALQRICTALALDIQLLKEEKKRDLDS